MADTAMTVVDLPEMELAVRRPAAVVLEEARIAARALADVVDKKPDPVMINGQRYLEYEDWQTVGRFYGVTAKVVASDYVEYGQVRGFTARAVALRSDGMEISAAESMCLNDEERWKGRELFQLKSMAQTRACAKALRNVLAWVVVLAGYGTTPAEEMDGVRGGRRVAASSQPERADGATTVASVSEHTKPGAKWKRYDVAFADGRKGATFDKAVGDEAMKAKATGGLVMPELVKGDKGTDLVKLVPVLEAHDEAIDEPKPGEPVVPETVLVTRKVAGANGAPDAWVVQGSERAYVTADPELLSLVEAVKANAAKVIFRYDIVRGARGALVRRLSGMDAPEEAPAKESA